MSKLRLYIEGGFGPVRPDHDDILRAPKSTYDYQGEYSLWSSGLER